MNTQVITEKRYNEVMQGIKYSRVKVDTNTGIITGPKGGQGYKTNTGYWQYWLGMPGKGKYKIISQHIIIACVVFGKAVIGKQVDHIDGRHRTQWDNRASNLQLLTPEENRRKFWNNPKRDQHKSETPLIYISKEEVKYYKSIISFCKIKHISPEYISKKEKANEYIPKLKGFVIFIHPRYKKNKQ